MRQEHLPQDAGGGGSAEARYRGRSPAVAYRLPQSLANIRRRRRTFLASPEEQPLPTVGGGGRITAFGSAVYMAADGFVFEGTVAENIAASSDMNSVDQQRLIDAMVDACLDPVKFQASTVVSATSVSGGERLRISLARALYSAGSILLLDDPVSALDPDIAEEFISECLVPLRQSHKRSVIIATNNSSILSTAADYVIDLSHRPIRCRGTISRWLASTDKEHIASSTTATSSRRASRRILFKAANNPLGSAGSVSEPNENSFGVELSRASTNSILAHDDAKIIQDLALEDGCYVHSAVFEDVEGHHGMAATDGRESTPTTEVAQFNNEQNTISAVAEEMPPPLVPFPQIIVPTTPPPASAHAPAPAHAVAEVARKKREFAQSKPLPLFRCIFETMRSGPHWWVIGLLIISLWRAVTYISERSLSDLLAKSPWLGRYPEVSGDSLLYLYIFGNITAAVVYCCAMVPLTLAISCMKAHTFDKLLAAVEGTNIERHEAAFESGALMTNFGDMVAKIDFSFFSIAMFISYLWFSFYLNYILIETLPYAAVGAGAMFTLWIALYVWFASREVRLGQVVFRYKAKCMSLTNVITNRVIEIRSHGLQTFLQEKLEFDVLNAAVSEYGIEVWARYVEFLADVVVSCFCLVFCLYVTLDLSEIASPNSMRPEQVAAMISSRAFAAYYAFHWKVAMAPLIIETNSIMRIWRSVGQIVAMANGLSGDGGAGNTNINVIEMKEFTSVVTSSSAVVDSFNSTNSFPFEVDAPRLDLTQSPGTSGRHLPILTLSNVQMRYGSGPLVLKRLSMTARPGTITAIRGGSGCGKSSLFLAMLGLYPICGGSIRFGSEHDIATDADWRSLCTWVPQEPFLIEGTILSNLYPGVDPSATSLQDRETAMQALESVGMGNTTFALDSPISQRGGNLSGGERQRVGIARALLQTSAKVLLMDEPTSHLDASSCADIIAIIKEVQCRQRNTTVIIISHQPIFAADQSIELRDGEAHVKSRTEGILSFPL
eukprot:GILI01006983.1.p1 GENE.GILI01006983.1~~GILI01006983.1.p1  ORF type:complete len:1006 (+),score=125.96 GILI01006983.1:451-3468(+)